MGDGAAEFSGELADINAQMAGCLAATENEFRQARKSATNPNEESWVLAERALYRSKNMLTSLIRREKAALKMFFASNGVHVENDVENDHTPKPVTPSVISPARRKPGESKQSWELRVLEILHSKLDKKRDEFVKSGKSTKRLDIQLSNIQSELRRLSETSRTPIPASNTRKPIARSDWGVSPVTERKENNTSVANTCDTPLALDFNEMFSKIMTGSVTPVARKQKKVSFTGDDSSLFTPDELIELISSTPPPSGKTNNSRYTRSISKEIDFSSGVPPTNVSQTLFTKEEEDQT
mmetsp:Transcript_45081/g.72038  ORF Transcript_45081/g.72038 Transcript_45081/m.72038 type:complete len:294 (+) Transcript_45081:264-1145(+)